MKRYYKIILILVLIPAVLVLGLAGYGIWLFYEIGKVNTVRYDQPMTLAEAREKQIDFPFPSSAHDIYYAFAYGGLQYRLELLRFSASPEDCAKEFSVVSASRSQDEINHSLKTTHVDSVNQEELDPVK